MHASAYEDLTETCFSLAIRMSQDRAKLQPPLAPDADHEGQEGGAEGKIRERRRGQGDPWTPTRLVWVNRTTLSGRLRSSVGKPNNFNRSPDEISSSMWAYASLSFSEQDLLAHQSTFGVNNESSGVLVAVYTHVDDGNVLDFLEGANRLVLPLQADVTEESINARRSANVPVTIREELSAERLGDGLADLPGAQSNRIRGLVSLLRASGNDHRYYNIVWRSVVANRAVDVLNGIRFQIMSGVFIQVFIKPNNAPIEKSDRLVHQISNRWGRSGMGDGDHTEKDDEKKVNLHARIPY